MGAARGKGGGKLYICSFPKSLARNKTKKIYVKILNINTKN
jgi:hypothetical protein